MPHFGSRIHARLRLHEVARRLPLDEIAGDGERAAGEADDSLLGAELVTDDAHGFENEGNGLGGLGHPQPLDAGEARDRLGDDRPDPVHELDVDPHADDGEHDVCEHHRRVDTVAPHRLQGHLRAELRLLTDLEEGVPGTDLAVLGQRPTGLAHEPDRRVLDVLAP